MTDSDEKLSLEMDFWVSLRRSHNLLPLYNYQGASTVHEPLKSKSPMIPGTTAGSSLRTIHVDLACFLDRLLLVAAWFMGGSLVQ